MKPFHLPSGLTQGLDFLIDADWTPEQALAVFELLDDLRERISDRYGLFIQECLHHDRLGHHEPDLPARRADEPPF